MTTYSVQIRLNVPAKAGSAFVEFVTPLAREVGLRVRNDAPGLLEGSGISLSQLGVLIAQLGQLPMDLAIATEVIESGMVDDLWIHVSRDTESPAERAGR